MSWLFASSHCSGGSATPSPQWGAGPDDDAPVPEDEVGAEVELTPSVEDDGPAPDDAALTAWWEEETPADPLEPGPPLDEAEAGAVALEPRPTELEDAPLVLPPPWVDEPEPIPEAAGNEAPEPDVLSELELPNVDAPELLAALVAEDGGPPALEDVAAEPTATGGADPVGPHAVNRNPKPTSTRR